MGKTLPHLSQNEIDFIASQKVFFVGTAPLSADHHVSLSPKSPGTSVAVLGPHSVAYADLTGSGAETAAHVLENGRMTLMFVSLENDAPKILRLFGNATIQPKDAVPESLKQRFPDHITENPGFRGVFQLNVTRISKSCGYSMPVMRFERYRKTLDEFAEKQGLTGMHQYQTKRNSFSIDGLPSVALLRKDAPPVEPCVEDGYVLGKVSSNPWSNGNSGTVPQYAVRKARMMHSVFKLNRFSLLAVVLLALVMFVVGFIVGLYFSNTSGTDVSYLRTDL